MTPPAPPVEASGLEAMPAAPPVSGVGRDLTSEPQAIARAPAASSQVQSTRPLDPRIFTSKGQPKSFEHSVAATGDQSSGQTTRNFDLVTRLIHSQVAGWARRARSGAPLQAFKIAARRATTGARMTQHFLAKSEPDVYSWDRLVQEGKAVWDGVRNFEARGNLRAMKKGDLVLFYHSGEGKEIVGIAKVLKEAYPDKSADDGDWVCVDLAPVKPLAAKVTLAAVKADASLAEMALVKRSRLSVSRVAPAEFARILKLGRTKL
jgi:predicted RNA-binding protein with PUA-like domain